MRSVGVGQDLLLNDTVTRDVVRTQVWNVNGLTLAFLELFGLCIATT
jgi:hypothetical protein